MYLIAAGSAVLLSATEQLDPETALKVKQEIIQSATNSWIQSISESSLHDLKPGEVKPPMKPDQATPLPKQEDEEKDVILNKN